jgi:hypothetical protein
MPVTITDYYHRIEELKGYLSSSVNSWKKQLKRTRDALPICTLGTTVTGGMIFVLPGFGGDNYNNSFDSYCMPCDGYYCAHNCIVAGDAFNPGSPIPCRFDTSQPLSGIGLGDSIYISGGTLDYNLNDEITPALTAIDGIVQKLDDFKEAIRAYVQRMHSIYNSYEENLNPAIYCWGDSRCPNTEDCRTDARCSASNKKACHAVSVQVGNYKVARTVKTESGGSWSKTICIRLTDYYDGGNNAWVEISRSGPESRELKSGKVGLGRWNPFARGKIIKRGKASYSYDRVGLVSP